MYRALRFNPNPRILNIVPDFITLRRRISDNALRIKTIYRNETRIVSVKHPLYLILQSLPVAYKGDKVAFVLGIQAATIQIAKTHNFTNPHHDGKIHTNKFIPENSAEVIIVNNRPFDIEHAINNWVDLEPVKVLRHPFGDTKMPVFTKSLRLEYLMYAHRVNDDAVYVFEINIAMLALQYVCWLESTSQNKDLRNILNFVSAIPLVNMIESWTNVAFFNRYVFFLRGSSRLQYPRLGNIHPFQIQETDSEIDRAMSKLVVHAKNETRDFARILAELMLPFPSSSLLDAANSYQDTYQIVWALNLVYLPIIAALLLSDSLGPKRTSMDIKRAISINIVRIRSGNFIRPFLPPEMFVKVERTINDDIKPYLQ